MRVVVRVIVRRGKIELLYDYEYCTVLAQNRSVALREKSSFPRDIVMVRVNTAEEYIVQYEEDDDLTKPLAVKLNGLIVTFMHRRSLIVGVIYADYFDFRVRLFALRPTEI